MSKPLGTIWDLEPHTAKKHELLRRYFEPWLAIMAKWNSRVVYIDGFAGPGRYSKGEDGSPIVVLKAARDHSYPVQTELVCIFVEDNPARCNHLKGVLDDLAPSLPKYISWKVIQGKFDEHLAKTLDILDAQAKALPPSFVFIDPFGISHTPFRTIRRILGNRKCEVLVNFMYEEVNRFLSLETLAGQLDELFGKPEWRRVIAMAGPSERRRAIHDLYLNQLKTVARYVQSFEMRNSRNSTDYFLFFATNNLKGLEKMKEAMWKVDGAGSFQFSDYEDASGQLYLFGDDPDVVPLRQSIRKRFGGQSATIEEVRDWVIAETAFLPKHLKVPVLKPMEEEGEVSVVNASPKRRRGTFSDGTILKFR